MHLASKGAPLLLIEEDPGLRRLFTDLLTEEGYDLVCTTSLEEGFRCVEEQTFALVLADVFLGPGSPDLPPAQALRARIYPVPLALLARLPLPPSVKQADFAFVLPLPFSIEACLSLIATTINTLLNEEQQAQAQIVQHLLEAIEAGDWEALAALHTDDVICVPPEHSRGTSARWLEGQAAFRHWAERLLQTYQQLRVCTTLLATTPRGLAVRYTMHWQEPGGLAQRAGTLFLRFRGERICQVGIRITLPRSPGHQPLGNAPPDAQPSTRLDSYPARLFPHPLADAPWAVLAAKVWLFFSRPILGQRVSFQMIIRAYWSEPLITGYPIIKEEPHMPHKLVSRREARIVLIAVLFALLASCASLLVQQPQTTRAAQPGATTPTTTAIVPSTTPFPNGPNPIPAENSQPGTTAWQMTNPALSTAIQAYADATSISQRQTLTFYVSTAKAGTAYTVQIFRLGWYRGAGGRLLQTLSEIGQVQGYYDPVAQKLVGCTRCLISSTTHRIEANWLPSFTVPIPLTWVTGVYEAKLVDANGAQAMVSFEVRGDVNSPYAVVVADNTTQAYNKWGGYSLYYGPDGSATDRAVEVSFDRPVVDWYNGSGNSLAYEIDGLRYLEAQGEDLSYLSSVDLQANPDQLLTHQVFISLGHDEYWSYTMRGGVENARAHGVSLVWLAGNDVYWQIRYTNDHLGIVNRVIVCYKSLADPDYGKENAKVTVRWRDKPVNRPENALLGAMYSGGSDNALVAFPWKTVAFVGWYNATNLEPNTTYGCNLVGPEWDSVLNNGQQPAGLTILSASSATNSLGQVQVSNSVIYQASSGALVFDAGSIYWTLALDDFHIWTVNPGQNSCFLHTVAIPELQALFSRILDTMTV